MSDHKDQTAGRARNAALPLGQGEGADSDGKAKAVGRREQRSAGPDGPSAKAVGATFKRGKRP